MSMPVSEPASEGRDFISRQQVRWDMMDPLGVLHNAVYLLLFERARTDFWRALGIDGYGAEGLDWPFYVVRNEINYRASINREQELEVTVRIARMGTSSLTFAHTVRTQDGRLSADGQTVIVRTDPLTQRPIPWSDAFRRLHAPYTE
jgi:acyl-CoA thioester hydrolase